MWKIQYIIYIPTLKVPFFNFIHPLIISKVKKEYIYIYIYIYCDYIYVTINIYNIYNIIIPDIKLN